MVDDSVHVGFLHVGSRTREQEAALEWLSGRARPAEPVTPDALADAPDRFDVVWWHRDRPLDAVDELRPAVRRYLAAGGGLLLTLRAMAAVEDFGIDPVPPDAVGTDAVAEPTGVLWRSLYRDHPAVSEFDAYRLPLCDCGAVPLARYERIVPERGEVLAGTVRGERDVPGEMSVVAWKEAEGSVLGVGAPLAFDEPVAAELAATRDTLAAGLLGALAGGNDQPSRPTGATELAGLRDRLPPDPARPACHFTPPANWLNDPNGLIEWNGRYHVFYQYNPAGPFHNSIHWGHAVSDDLVHWADEPLALAPSPDGPDRDGCWSGCAVDDDGTPTVVYTGGDGRVQLPCLATSDDPGLRTWEKYEGNPVIQEPPADLPILETEHWAAEFRDHNVWRADGRWHQVIGTGLADGRGAALLYTSPDLREWTYEGPLLLGEEGEGDTVWECPELLDLGEKQLLHVSNYDHVRYFLGDLADGELAVEREGLLDYGDFYAPQSLADGDRYLTWGWLPEARSQADQWDAGWSGVLSLPRIVSVGPDGTLRQRPAPEVTDLRGRRLLERSSVPVAPGERHSLAASGRTLELHLSVALADADAFELSVFESPDGGTGTTLRYTSEELVVETDDGREPAAMPLAPRPADEELSLRVFLDNSVCTVFADERRCLTRRVYPDPDHAALSVAATGGAATLSSLMAWQLRPVRYNEASRAQRH